MPNTRRSTHATVLLKQVCEEIHEQSKNTLDSVCFEHNLQSVAAKHMENAHMEVHIKVRGSGPDGHLRPPPLACPVWSSAVFGHRHGVWAYTDGLTHAARSLFRSETSLCPLNDPTRHKNVQDRREPKTKPRTGLKTSGQATESSARQPLPVDHNSSQLSRRTGSPNLRHLRLVEG